MVETSGNQPHKDTLAFNPDPAWDAGKVQVTTVDVSQWEEESNKYAKVLTNILTQQECNEMIERSENKGYEQALLNTGRGEVLMSDVRNNDRCIIDSPQTMEFIWQRVLSACKDDEILLRAAFTGKKLHAVGLNERMRLLRYDPGAFFAPHGDGSFYRQNGDKRGECSYVTFQLYLNEGFEGGATRIFSIANEDVYFDVIPRAGSVLLFQHNMYHEGSLLIKGRKYALRSDVMYTEKGEGHEYATNPVVFNDHIDKYSTPEKA